MHLNSHREQRGNQSRENKYIFSDSIMIEVQKDVTYVNLNLPTHC